MAKAVPKVPSSQACLGQYRARSLAFKHIEDVMQEIDGKDEIMKYSSYQTMYL